MLIDVKQAMTITGKSQYTINMFCQKHINTKFIKKMNGKYFIENTYLAQYYQPLNEEIKAPIIMQTNNNEDLQNTIIGQLKETIVFLKGQIDKKDDQINSLIERSREVNFILQTVNKRLALKAENKEKKKKK